MAFAPEKALDLMRQAHLNGRLAHAFLISGPEMADLQHLAVEAAALVNGWTAVETLDDLRKRGAVVLEPESKIRRIKIDGGCYEVYAMNERGERVEAYFHPRTFAPVPTGSKDFKG